MDTRLLEPNVLHVFLPSEPQLQPELALLREQVAHMAQTHLVLDLSRVEIITSASIGSLLLMQKQLARQGRRLVLCCAHLATACIFQVAGLDKLLEFAENESEALAVVRTPSPSPA